MPTLDPFLCRLCDELTQVHGAHTLLLYGSRADGSAGPDSDYDIAAFAACAVAFRVARPDPCGYVDAFVYPQEILDQPSRDLFKLRGSRVLAQRGTEADDFLRRLDAIHAHGPEAMPPDEIAARRVWAHKMADRIERGDVEGNYRRVWLLQALLEDHFLLRDRWYDGPKKALRWLSENEPEVHLRFVAALEPGAGNAEIRALVDRVAGPRASSDTLR